VYTVFPWVVTQGSPQNYGYSLQLPGNRFQEPSRLHVHEKEGKTIHIRPCICNCTVYCEFDVADDLKVCVVDKCMVLLLILNSRLASD
jgi:hypothetical protein